MLTTNQTATDISRWRLDSANTTLVFAWNGDVPVMAYHGDKLSADADLSTLIAIQARPLPHGTLDENLAISLHPELGRGFLGHPALIAHRPTSSQPGWAGQFVFSRAEEIENGVVFGLVDADRGLDLELECRLDPQTDVLTMRNRIRNDADSEIDIEWLAAPVYAPAQQFSQHLSFHGRWCAEFAIERQQIPMGLTKRENRRGRTSHEAFPGTILLDEHTDQESGPCVGLHFGWSGNHRLILERLSTGDVQIQMGVLLFAGEVSLKPGESLETPELYVAYSGDGLNVMSQRLHSHVRSQIIRWPNAAKPRPVTVNTWEAIYFDHTHEKLVELVDAAADVGAERFVLDDGWFKGRDDDTTSLGDWFADERKYPQGLQPLVDYVHSKGLEFGLWVEPEMVNEESDLYRDHPDWVLGVGNYQRITGRNQQVLNLANLHVSDYLFERLSTLVRDHSVTYLKWDMNRDLVLPGDATGKATVFRQTYALYALIDRLLAAFPALEIESCASGGGRIDYEILKRTHRFWTSDSNDAVERVWIQSGFSYFFPPEIMGAHVGPAWSHTSGRGLHMGLRTLVASYGHMGIEADLTKMTDADRARAKEAVMLHKADRAIWHEGNFRRIRTIDPNLVGVMSITQDHASARLIMIQTDRPKSTVPPRVQVRGLDQSRKYRVVMANESEQVTAANRKFENPIAEGGFIATGDMLAKAGIGLPSLYAQTGVAISIDAIDEPQGAGA